ncbi:Ger(x)C family spore germination protein [Neobacillus sp. PS3-40]|uniref:Ger(x)C family spore germination protein n=1 Tax=Neobacillus sp. PS3-40 TaxID=3070679 RepID=UPI0027E21566|nr:Ger(x)C family spore germination protein [Neobacillus sp. PS3-40]WML44224.1 Ger(x)C family spore germination protein [Neobacillus sp. PS3-40]
MPKIIIPLLLLFTVLLLTGCWDRQEVNDLALVTAAGVDRNSDGSIELSVLVFIPKGKSSQQGVEGGSGGGGSVQTLVRSADGKTIADAMSKLQEKIPRHIFWGHCKVFIFDEELAKNGVAPQVDFILRHPQLRERAQLFVSEQKTKEILNLIPPLERDISEVLREFGSFKIGMEITAKDFSQMLISESQAGAIPWIKILPPEQGEKNQSIAYITGTAIFIKGKMIGRIDDSITRGVLWFRDEVRIATITVKPKVRGGGYVSMNILRANTKLIPKIVNGKWKIKLHAVADTDIIQNTTNLDMARPEIVKPLEEKINKQIKNKANEALAQVQKEMNADIFGFADAFHRKYPKEWAKQKYRWNEIFPTLEVTIEANIKIRRQGMNSVLSNNPQKEVLK